jgi:hypothetical protein
MKLTVKEYASRFKISVQAVYQRLNKGTLKSIEENGTKYVLVDKKDIKEIEQPLKQENDDYFKEVVKDLFKQLKEKDEKIESLEDKIAKRDKEIKKLNKRLLKSVQAEKQTLINFITEQQRLIQNKRVDDVIDADFEESKKKSKSKKRKK